MKNEALKLSKLGFKVIPTGSDKRPLVKWKQYQDSQTTEQVEQIFSRKSEGMALLTGKGIEVIDIDVKYFLEGTHDVRKVFDALFDALGQETYSRLLVTHTKSKGFHIIYRTNVSEGNMKLASRYSIDEEKKSDHDNVRVLLETRGEGGYICIPPTPGYTYKSKIIQFENIPTLTDDERNTVISVCRSFDEVQESYNQTKASIPIKVSGMGKSTIEAFNESHTPIEFLEDAGWVFKYNRGGNAHYIRPGKSLSEGVGCGYSDSLKLVRIFTSSTEFEPNKTYNAFQTFAVLSHGGNYSKACKELYLAGYGDRLKKNRDTFSDKLNALSSSNENEKERATNDDRMAAIFATRFSILNVPPVIEYNLFLRNVSDGSRMEIASFGDWVTVVGAAKSRKSAITNSIVGCLLSDGMQEVLNFSGEVKNRNIVLLDTEQNSPDYYKSQKQIYTQAAIEQGIDPDNFYSFCLTDCRMDERLEFISYVMEKVGNVGLLVIDGIVDVCEDYNDQKGVRKLIDHLKVLTSKHNTLMMPVLHNARSTGSARGHLGTELINKSKAVIKVTKDKDSKESTVEFEYLRGSSDPPTFNFAHNLQGELILL
jgi:hypothetical protein